MPTQAGSATLSGTGTLVSQGVVFEYNEDGILYAKKYVGEGGVPQDIKRLRRQVYDVMRHMGAPVLVKHMFNAGDVEDGIARRSDNYDDVYGQTRNRDPVSHGIGYVSVENSDDEWVTQDGHIVKADVQPAGSTPAPKYRGFGPGYLIYLIQPDVSEDFFKVDPTGALIKVQEATAQAPWFPEINDNDLLINVEVNNRTHKIVQTHERFQAKMSTPTSIRGFGDRFGRREYTEDGGNRFVVNQSFQMALLPPTDEMQRVETDR